MTATETERRRKIGAAARARWAGYSAKQRAQALSGIGRGVPKPCQVRPMVEVERAWLGAFIEADGSASLCGGRPVVALSQRDVEMVATALRLTQVGGVNLSRDGQWSWYTTRRLDALSVARQCAPYSPKLQRLLEVLADED